MEDPPLDTGIPAQVPPPDPPIYEPEPTRDLWRLLKLSWLGDTRPVPSGADD